MLRMLHGIFFVDECGDLWFVQFWFLKTVEFQIDIFLCSLDCTVLIGCTYYNKLVAYNIQIIKIFVKEGATGRL